MLKTGMEIPVRTPVTNVKMLMVGNVTDKLERVLVNITMILV